MAQFDVLDMNGKKVSTVELSDAVFGITPNEKAVHAAVVNFLANQRQALRAPDPHARFAAAAVSLASEGHRPRPSGLYPCSPVDPRRIVFAPKPRTYRYTLNKKVKRLALKSALSAKAASGDILVVDGLKLDEVKTKAMKASWTASRPASPWSSPLRWRRMWSCPPGTSPASSPPPPRS